MSFGGKTVDVAELLAVRQLVHHSLDDDHRAINDQVRKSSALRDSSGYR
jgi:hypothetical protein